jgi:uncharacterized membrane protein YebE (DUF533 family)
LPVEEAAREPVMSDLQQDGVDEDVQCWLIGEGAEKQLQ